MGTGVLDDIELMKCLWRVSLDALRRQEPSTISQNRGKINRALQIAHKLAMNLSPLFQMGHIMA
jgi:hypothetical protein